MMSKDSDVLKAFLTTYRQGSFTKASASLGLTQSALSQKIARLEDYLQATLFIRKSEGLELTSAGEKLMAYAKEALLMEDEFLKNFHQNDGKISGVFRLASYSSVVRSVLIPSLTDFLQNNSGVNFEFSSFEVVELEHVLKTNKADAIITDYMPNQPGMEHIILGQEEYVIIESAKHDNIPKVFLDHGPHDNATDSYFNFLDLEKNYRRGFMGDVYGILDGVAYGLGRAVMSKHLIKNDKRFRIKKHKKAYFRPIVLSYYKQSYYPPVYRQIFELLIQKVPRFL